ncbi:MAG: lysine--tRNA ligase [Betaproteobacteria bacterium TMED82]|nr:MAG: lysine--tRNA ligase [Betaproteobacteria bacterium TMED82]|tara:strand:- start:3066 stop:4607 length:1542 start_codon:yes stop_codon:yes gene_type:complete
MVKSEKIGIVRESKAEAEESKIVFERREKLKKLSQKCQIMYPNTFSPSNKSKELLEKFDKYEKAVLERLDSSATLGGRVMLKRVQGKSTFMSIKDSAGKFQLYFNREIMGNESYAEIKSFDLGDLIYVEGKIFKTMRGELTLSCTAARLLAKSIQPLPDKYHGLQDPELRYRNRHLDLIMNEHSKEVFLKRAKLLSELRNYMEKSNFLEVETPMLHPIPGGATAKPFITKHNALDQEMYLRIAPELYLKRLIVSGFEKVFELNRSFRNEGISTRHNPEFTMLEFYAAYTDYIWVMNFTERLIRDVKKSIVGEHHIIWKDQTIDLDKPFVRLSIEEAILKYVEDMSIKKARDKNYLVNNIMRSNSDLIRADLKKLNLEVLQLMLFEEFVEEKLVQPTFIIDHPVEVSPLAKLSDKNDKITERFELYICGREIANGFSELNDPEEQARRFALQAADKDAGNEEAMHFDAEYIKVLECGMPPTGGCGIGVDRLAMLMTGSESIRDVIFFPALRQRS